MHWQFLGSQLQNFFMSTNLAFSRKVLRRGPLVVAINCGGASSPGGWLIALVASGRSLLST